MTQQTRIGITVDGQAHSLPAGTTLGAFVAQLGHGPAAVATAVNGVFVPRDRRADRPLGDGDAVMLFRPIVGG